jgi:hypothetical protein
MVFQAGDILAVNWDDRPIRVLQTDAIETFYDCEFEGLGWVFARPRTAIYYRIKTSFLEATAQLKVSEPFSPTELDKFRPDLPMRLFRHSDADWSDDLEKLVTLETNFSLAAEQIAIIPFGAKGGSTRPIRIKSFGDEGISLQTIVEVARGAQQVRCEDVRGVGLYRSGTTGGVPSYYLWGAIDRAGHAV